MCLSTGQQTQLPPGQFRCTESNKDTSLNLSQKRHCRVERIVFAESSEFLCKVACETHEERGSQTLFDGPAFANCTDSAGLIAASMYDDTSDN